MKDMEKSDMRQQELQDLVQEAGVEELMDLYRKVEEVYVAAHGTGTPIPWTSSPIQPTSPPGMYSVAYLGGDS